MGPSDNTKPPLFEASLYGPLNSLLNMLFPAIDHYMVQPQALLQNSYPSEHPFPDSPIRPRADGFPHPWDLFRPDFAVVKVDPNGEFPDIIVAIIVVKRTDETLGAAWCRLSHYAQVAFPKCRYENTRSFLVVGDKITEYRYKTVGNQQGPKLNAHLRRRFKAVQFEINLFPLVTETRMLVQQHRDRILNSRQA
ncbi:hypothetical protein FISHEDRAFT_55360 [Fistulina hepatica ATCC 64428]|uniref:Uncharacterized protein n=1 Tax=Fistulina hepatica ATCC 64428 TaxID=1128425 RepID=A0A0D7ANH5_9AGAR|nr:hypothetical protein FISHEDRAFT_55360 [Fistulina hepatica ATCC 64428]